MNVARPALIKSSCLQEDATPPFEDARDGLSVGERWDALNNYSGPRSANAELRDPALWHFRSSQMRLVQKKAWWPKMGLNSFLLELISPPFCYFARDVNFSLPVCKVLRPWLGQCARCGRLGSSGG